jgi:Domain of unknown function (DUF4911)
MIASDDSFTSIKRYFLLDRHDVAYLKFIVEAYEGLATLSTLERNGDATLVRLSVLPCSAPDLDSLINELRHEIAMTETMPPRVGEEDHHA